MTPDGSSPRAAAGDAQAGFCDGCGRPAASGDHAQCRARRAATDPPRFCTACARRLAVQVLPTGYTARCVRCGPR